MSAPIVPLVNKPVGAVVHSYTTQIVGALFLVLSLTSNPSILSALEPAITKHDVASIVSLVGIVSGALLISLGRGPMSGTAPADAPAKGLLG